MGVGCWLSAVGKLKTSRFRNRTRLMQFMTVSLSDNLNLHNGVSLRCRFCSSVRQCMQIRPLGSLIVGLLGQPMDTKKLRDRDHPLAPLRLLPDGVPQIWCLPVRFWIAARCWCAVKPWTCNKLPPVVIGSGSRGAREHLNRTPSSDQHSNYAV